MPATKRFAGMACSYRCPAKCISDTGKIIVVFNTFEITGSRMSPIDWPSRRVQRRTLR
jgi:hypothetical protein